MYRTQNFAYCDGLSSAIVGNRRNLTRDRQWGLTSSTQILFGGKKLEICSLQMQRLVLSNTHFLPFFPSLYLSSIGSGQLLCVVTE
jgi:hypothetical protein